jgi:hypothetical protein
MQTERSGRERSSGARKLRARRVRTAVFLGPRFRDRGPFDSIVEVRSLDSFGVWMEDSFPLLPFLKFFPLCFADALADVIFAGFVCNVS